ncbi:spermine oxidase-like [Diorhabda sublineata]|uniref:spermine oxidase-like n=1 Tax=Diorhabda sublineata TaxID=1163346 RepID=UPI0024E05F75|nr:spermine oxidase-like [Diorhabda sublineata]
MKPSKLLLVILSILVASGVCRERYKIVIVGAGAAGIATATKLLENGIDDILVLEAESRIGGRINTVDFHGCNVDLGAEWVGGEVNNVVYETLKGRNLLYLLARDVFPEKFYLSSRQKISEKLSKELFDAVFAAFDINTGTGAHNSTGSVIQQRYRESIIKKFKAGDGDMDIFIWAEVFLRHFFLFAKGSFSWYDNAYTSDHETCPGYQNYGWKNHGYGKFLDVLIRKYPNPSRQLPFFEKLLVDKEVTKITVNDDHIVINCSDNSHYKANHVVFTTSIGVLKENHKKLFSPKLPIYKQLAIERIGIGAVIKVFLKYEHEWWGNSSGFNFIWTEKDRISSSTEFPEGPENKYGQSWITEIYNVIVIPNSRILLVVFTGDMVPIIEKLDVEIVTNGIKFTLKKFLGHLYKIMEPQTMIRSNWYHNPHFRGTYSFSSINSTGEDVKNLMAPIKNAEGCPIILFAGEATSPLHHSSAHGAVESGFREAERLINIYKN